MSTFATFLILAENYNSRGWALFGWLLVLFPLLCLTGLSVLILDASVGRRTRWGLVLGVMQIVAGMIFVVVFGGLDEFSSHDPYIVAVVLVMSIPLLFGIASLCVWGLPPMKG